LVIAHKRQWGWRYVDEFCWRKTDNGVPGGWPNRFKNAWEPVQIYASYCTSYLTLFLAACWGAFSEELAGAW
jgi:hypothetical protein